MGIQTKGRRKSKIAHMFSRPTPLPDLDYADSWAPTVRPSTWRLQLDHCASADWEARQIDYVAAYTNAKRNTPSRPPQFQEQPFGYESSPEKGKPNTFQHISDEERKMLSIYGARDAGHNWWEDLLESTQEFGFNQSSPGNRRYGFDTVLIRKETIRF